MNADYTSDTPPSVPAARRTRRKVADALVRISADENGVRVSGRCHLRAYSHRRAREVVLVFGQYDSSGPDLTSATTSINHTINRRYGGRNAVVIAYRPSHEPEFCRLIEGEVSDVAEVEPNRDTAAVEPFPNIWAPMRPTEVVSLTGDNDYLRRRTPSDYAIAAASSSAQFHHQTGGLELSLSPAPGAS